MSVREGNSWKQLDVTPLGKYLWKAADIMRGSIDASDFKNYIFGMVFLKRISDLFEEQYDKNVEKHGKVRAEKRVLYEIFVEERARWSELRKQTQDRGGALNKAFKVLEDDNPQLKDIFSGIDFAQTDRIPDETIERLMQHFDGVRLRNSDLSQPDILGRAYEYLIHEFADKAGKKGGEFYTPPMVVELLVKLLKPDEGMTVYDPTAGSGGMLIQSAKYLTDQGKNEKNLPLYGQEKNLGTWAISKMNMIFHGLADADIRKGDTIRNPKHKEDGRLMQFDIVIANPPFSLKGWGDMNGDAGSGKKGKKRSIADPGVDSYNRFAYGTPPTSYGDFGFVQHMIASCKPHGCVGVVVPHGVLFRGGGEGKIRTGMLVGDATKQLKGDLIEAVIGLPANLFFGTGIPGAILIINKNKPENRKNKILFIHAADEYEAGKAQNFLREEDLVKIVGTFDEYKELERYSRVAEMAEIEENDYVLNITRYVDTSEPEEEIDLEVAVAEWRVAMKERDAATKVVEGYLEELGIGN